MGSQGRSPSNIAPARMPGVYATRLCRTQSQPSVLKGIEDKHFFEKNILFLQSELYLFGTAFLFP